jgi:hypothetical protein
MKFRPIGIVVAGELKILLEHVLRHPPTRGVRNPMLSEVFDLRALSSLGFATGQEKQGQAPACRGHCRERRQILFFSAVDENTRMTRANSTPGQDARGQSSHDVSSVFRT